MLKTIWTYRNRPAFDYNFVTYNHILNVGNLFNLLDHVAGNFHRIKPGLTDPALKHHLR